MDDEVDDYKELFERNSNDKKQVDSSLICEKDKKKNTFLYRIASK